MTDSWLDATAQAELVRDGAATPRELVDEAIARIDALNPQLNAVIHERFAAARAEADGDLLSGPFRGVPFLMKDAVCHEAGEPYHFGMQVLKDLGYRAETDTWLVERYRAAGLVSLGRTNLPEMASTVTTEPVAYGPTRNPWDLDRSTGGSSGGAAAAVASGMVAAAHGNDMGGSIRFPASWCGLVGLKPTRARTTLGPDFGELWGPTTHEHVLTRSVRDSTGILDAVCGAGVGDPYEIAPPARPYRDEIGADPGRVRIGFRTRRGDGTGDSEPDVVRAVEGAATLCETLGHQVAADPVTALDDPRFGDAVAGVWAGIIAREVDRWGAAIGRQIEVSELEPLNQQFVALSAGTSASGYLAGIEAMQGYAHGIAAWFAHFDVMMLPTVPEPAMALGRINAAAPDPLAQLLDSGRLTTFTMPFNLTGQPAISLPLGTSADGLPIGVQLVAPFGREDVLFRLASQLDRGPVGGPPPARRRVTHHPFRFGLQLTPDVGAAVADAQRAEQLGFDVVHTFDHVGPDLMPALVPLAAIAASTDRIRLCPLVVNNDFHHPVHLARDVLAIDHLSGGRMELGIGAGHSFTEYAAIGAVFDPASVRKARLAEAVEVLRRLLDGDEVTHAGPHYRLDEAAVGRPPDRPVSILVGVNGRSALAHAAAHADTVGLTMVGKTLADGQRHETRWEADRLDATVAHIRDAADAAGRDPVLQVLVQQVVVTRDRDAVARGMVDRGVVPTTADAKATPFVAIGTHEEIAEHLRACRERWGISYFSVRDADAFAPVMRLVGD